MPANATRARGLQPPPLIKLEIPNELKSIKQGWLSGIVFYSPAIENQEPATWSKSLLIDPSILVPESEYGQSLDTDESRST